MAFIRSLSLLTVLSCGAAFIHAGGNASGTRAEVHSMRMETNVSSGIPLLAPLYHNVTAGEVWVYPSSKFDLGARSMNCECFDPADSCCMPKSTDLAPFCMSKNSTCCADTFCVAGEICCGDFCCAANTTCNLKTIGSGCCPKGTICTSPPKCYDYSSSNCTNTLFPRQECCPADLPYCRDLKPSGSGCYASSTSKAASTDSGTRTSSKPPATPTATISTESTTTVTISVLSNEAGLSIAFPAVPTTGPPASTKYVLDFPGPSTSSTSTSTSTSPTSSKSASTSTASFTSTSSTYPTPLCFNTDLQSPAACPSTTTTSTPQPPTASPNYSPPGASIYRSPASRPHPWTNLPDNLKINNTTTATLALLLLLLLILTFSTLYILRPTTGKPIPAPSPPPSPAPSPAKQKQKEKEIPACTPPTPTPGFTSPTQNPLTPSSPNPPDRKINVLLDTGHFIENGAVVGEKKEENEKEKDEEGDGKEVGAKEGNGKEGLEHVFVFRGGSG